MTAKDAEVEAFKARIGTSADEQDQADLTRLEKEQQKLRSQLSTAEKAEVSARKKTGSLETNLARNEKAQADMAIKIERQEALVEELRQKRAAIQ